MNKNNYSIFYFEHNQLIQKFHQIIDIVEADVIVGTQTLYAKDVLTLD